MYYVYDSQIAQTKQKRKIFGADLLFTLNIIHSYYYKIGKEKPLKTKHKIIILNVKKTDDVLKERLERKYKHDNYIN